MLDFETKSFRADAGTSPLANPATGLNTGEGGGSDIVPGATSTPYDLSIGDSVAGFVNTALDQDWYRVQLVAGQTYTFTLTATSGVLDCWVEVHDAGGGLLALDDDSGPGTDSVLQFLCTTSGTYYVAAQAYHDSTQSSTGGYLLQSSVSATPPDILQSIDWGSVVANPTNITVYFAAAGESFGGFTSQGWNAYQQQQAMLAFQQYANVANLNFSITLNSASATFKLVTANLSGGTLGQMSPPGEVGAGIGIFATNTTSWATGPGGALEQGGNGFVTLVHEFGHGLGLAHPHDNGGTSSVMQRVLSPFNSYGLFDLDQGVFTTMSYNRGWATGPNGVIGSSQFDQGGPMALDIALIQQKYGANLSYHIADDTYQLPTSNTITTYYSTIWDAGGNDTIAYGGSAHANIDLNAATIDYTASGGGNISWVDGIYGGFTIARGAVIENASGGSAGDTLIGNGADNHLSGNGGNDTLYGNDGADTLDGGAGNNTLDGGAGNDVFTLSSGGNDTVFGGDGNDTFLFGAAFNGGDTVNGGLGSNDQLGLLGNYTGANAVVFGQGQVTGVEVVVGMPGGSYDFTTNDSMTAAGQTLVLFGGNLGPSDSFTVNGASNVNTSLFMYGGLGADHLTGGSASDAFYFGPGKFSNATDTINGGAGNNDQFGLDGNYTVTLSGANITGVEVIVMVQKPSAALNTFNLTTADSLVAAGTIMTIYGAQVVNPITFNGAAETNGAFKVFAGHGADSMTGGAGADWFWGGEGGDTLTGGAGSDTFWYQTASESSSVGFDAFPGFDFNRDGIDLPGIHDTYAYVLSGALNAASFDADLAAALGGMAVNQAVFFEPTSGSYAGSNFLIVDANGLAGYQAGADYVFRFDVAAPHDPPPDFIV
jgi:serralysin